MDLLFLLVIAFIFMVMICSPKENFSMSVINYIKDSRLKQHGYENHLRKYGERANFYDYPKQYYTHPSTYEFPLRRLV